MSNKIIETLLTKNNENQIILEFSIGEDKRILNLESSDSKLIKELFLKISELLKFNSLSINFSVDESVIDKKSDLLFIDAATEYIEQLKTDLNLLENDNDLKELRKLAVKS